MTHLDTYVSTQDHHLNPELPSKERFLSAFGNHPSGVALITADAGDGPAGLTATSVASVSADPPMVMFSASVGSSSTPVVLAARTVVVHRARRARYNARETLCD